MLCLASGSHGNVLRIGAEAASSFLRREFLFQLPSRLALQLFQGLKGSVALCCSRNKDAFQLIPLCARLWSNGFIFHRSLKDRHSSRGIGMPVACAHYQCCNGIAARHC